MDGCLILRDPPLITRCISEEDVEFGFETCLDSNWGQRPQDMGSKATSVVNTSWFFSKNRLYISCFSHLCHSLF